MSVLIGIALSATCGFRVFVPLLAVNIGTRAQNVDGEPLIELAAGFDWLSSDIAMMVFLVATLFEIGGSWPEPLSLHPSSLAWIRGCNGCSA